MTAELRIPEALDIVKPEYVPPKETFQVFSGNQIRELPATEWLLHNVVPKSGMTILYGASRHGKTLVAVQWAMELVRPRVSTDWAGHVRSERGPFNVLYLCGEGGSQFNARLEAWRENYAADFETEWGKLHMVLQPVRLFMEGAKEWPELLDLESTVDDLDIDVVFVDTLHSMTAGAEENSAKDMGKVMEVLRKVVNKGKSVVMVHHTRKGDDELRGSSSLEAGVDNMILCKANTDGARMIDMQVINYKNKAGKPWSDKYFVPVEWEGRFTEFDEFPANAVTLVEADEPVDADNELKERLKVTLRNNPGLKRTPLYEATTGSTSKLKEALDELIEIGEVRNIDGGLYVVQGEEVDSL